MIFETVHNYYEKMVINELQKAIQTRRLEVDSSQLEDIACIALNKLPPRYIKHDVDALFYLTADQQVAMYASVEAAVGEAIDFVLKHPKIDH
ncbi:MAG: late competence development ComFB family protein [Pseudomonadota bacterium]